MAEMAKRNHQFQTIRTEGAILPPDILRRIASLKVDGVTSDAYHLPPGSKLNEAISQSWTSLLTHWQAFQEARELLPDSDETGTAVTNERWLLPLFKELDYGRLVTTKSPEIDERVYPIERFYNHAPIHLIGCKLPLDRRTKGARGAATASPHSMVQEYLNRSDQHLWAFLSNGLQLRILRDNVSLSRQAFVEFDLEAMMEGEVYPDFALLWLLCHQSRVEMEKPEDCWLEKWSQLARDEGTRVLKDLRIGVAKAIESLGRGFIGHPRNDRLREQLQIGTLGKDEFYRQLLRIVYRLLFLFVAEDRELLHSPESSEEARNLYDSHYSTHRLRELALKIVGSKHADLWHSLSLVFDALGKNEGCPQLALCGLGSFLWRTSSTADLLGPHQLAENGDTEPVFITNDDLLQAIRELAYVEQDRVLRIVDYRNLGSEELGSVYEALLELHPVMNVEAKSFELLTAAGNERKITGSYYTPDSLVQCLLDSALDPVVANRLKGKKGQDAEQAILEMKVCDPACGSGHFLIAAAHRLARHLARVRTGEAEPSPDDYQHALRDVIGRCFYGVDVNPMAVELCKVSLWIESLEPGKPLSFLDSHIQCGNSLLGSTPALLANGIPNDAFKPIEGDDKSACSELKGDNRRERKEYSTGQGYLFEPFSPLGNLPAAFAALETSDDDTVHDIAEKERRYAELVRGASYQNARLWADTWCAAFVWKKDRSDIGRLCPTERVFRSIERNPHSVLPHVREEVERLSGEYRFLHWHLSFPDVFRLPSRGDSSKHQQTGWDGGFDAVLGNPPWDKVQPEEQKFFSGTRDDIAGASSGAKRKKLIAALERNEPQLFCDWLAYKRRIEGLSHLVKDGMVLPLTSKGNLNSYRLFAELASVVVNRVGRVGMVLQTGLATDQNSSALLASLMESDRLIKFLDFENRGNFFADVHAQFRFALVTLGARFDPHDSSAVFGWLLHSLSDINNNGRLVYLTSDDLFLFNPTTGTSPTFKSQRDLAINRQLYCIGQHIYVDENNRVADVDFLGELFNMTRDSALFVPNEGDMLSDKYIPLYEAKAIHQFDHRYAGIVDGEFAEYSVSLKENPHLQVSPKSFVPASELQARLSRRGIHTRWLLGFRDVSSATNERTAIFSIFPASAVGNSINLLLNLVAEDALLLLANGNSFAFDYACREKMSGMHVNIWILKQLPAIPFATYRMKCKWARGSVAEWIRDRAIELVYTSWDLKPFAEDVGWQTGPYHWDEERRFLLRCELDAAYFHLYGVSGEDVSYIFETFPIVKRKDLQQYDVYRTKHVTLEIYNELQAAIDTGGSYSSRLNPLPASNSIAHDCSNESHK